MSRPTPIQAAQEAVQAAWDAPQPGEPDRFPSTYGTASAVLKALFDHGYRIVDAGQHDQLLTDVRTNQIEVRRLQRELDRRSF
jgi:hypothetical protein